MVKSWVIFSRSWMHSRVGRDLPMWRELEMYSSGSSYRIISRHMTSWELLRFALPPILVMASRRFFAIWVTSLKSKVLLLGGACQTNGVPSLVLSLV